MQLASHLDRTALDPAAHTAAYAAASAVIDALGGKRRGRPAAAAGSSAPRARRSKEGQHA